MVKTEVLVYKEIFPEFQRLRKDLGLQPLKVPRCFYADQESLTIIMEDLKDKDFELIEKTCEVAKDSFVDHGLKELAKIHATGYHYIDKVWGGSDKLLEQYPYLKPYPYMDAFPKEGPMREMIEKGVTDNFAMCANVIGDSHPELAEKLLEQVARFESVHAKTGIPRPDCSFITLTHGDFWYNNMMAK